SLADVRRVRPCRHGAAQRVRARARLLGTRIERAVSSTHSPADLARERARRSDRAAPGPPGSGRPAAVDSRGVHLARRTRGLPRGPLALAGTLMGRAPGGRLPGAARHRRRGGSPWRFGLLACQACARTPTVFRSAPIRRRRSKPTIALWTDSSPGTLRPSGASARPLRSIQGWPCRMRERQYAVLWWTILSSLKRHHRHTAVVD